MCVLWRTRCWHRNCLQEAAVPGGAPLAGDLHSLPVCCEAGTRAHTCMHAHLHRVAAGQGARLVSGPGKRESEGGKHRGMKRGREEGVQQRAALSHSLGI